MDQISKDRDYVVIRRTPNGRFLANGSAVESTGALYYQTAVFQTLEKAIAEASEWAKRKQVGVVHVLNCGETTEPDLPQTAIAS
ncbi:MAG: hypothetical protein U1E42_14560 [Rhodospirillales bacterium]